MRYIGARPDAVVFKIDHHLDGPSQEKGQEEQWTVAQVDEAFGKELFVVGLGI